MRETAHWHARLTGIELPRVEINDPGLALVPVQMPNSPFGHRIWKEAEVSTACHREAQSEPGYGRKRELGNFPPGAGRQSVGKARRVGDSVAIMDDREDTGIVPKSGLDQGFQTPKSPTHHREGRSPVADHHGPGRILDASLGPPQILGQLRPAEPSEHLVVVPVAGNLMALALDGANQ